MAYWEPRYVRSLALENKRRHVRNRTSEFYVRVEPDADYDPRDYDCYTEADLAKFKSGEWRTWEIVVYRTCPDHIGLECRHSEIIDSLCGIDVADDTDLEGDYSSPYFIDHPYVRECAWEIWQRRNDAL